MIACSSPALPLTHLCPSNGLTSRRTYAARLSFLLTRQFQCEYSGKSSLDYFTALQSEKQESKIVRERFPDPLKGRVLASVQFRAFLRSLLSRAHP